MPVSVVELFGLVGIGVIFGIVSMVMKRLDIAKEYSDLVMTVGYLYMLIFIAVLIGILMESLRTTFMLTVML